MGVYLLISQKEMKMNEYKTTSEYEITFAPVDPKSMAYIGSESYKITIAID